MSSPTRRRAPTMSATGPESHPPRQQEGRPMSAVFGALRKNALAPSLSEVTFAERGFPARDTADARNLQSIPQHVIVGFEFGIEYGDRPEAVQRLDMIEREFRGFA